MAGELAYTVGRISYLVLLWLLVLAAVNVLRRDIFGTVVTPRGPGRRARDLQRKKSRIKEAKGRAVTKLLITGGPLVGTSLTLGSADVIIGRSPASTLVIDDDYASSQHARLSLSDEGWWIEDLGSTNGTFVDDERISQPVLLTHGVNVRVGQTTMELVS